MQIGKTVRRLREHRGQTLKELAESCGLSLSYLSLIERDKREPSLANLSKLAEVFDLPPSILVLLSADADTYESDKSGLSNLLMEMVEEVLKDDERYPSLTER